MKNYRNLANQFMETICFSSHKIYPFLENLTPQERFMVVLELRKINKQYYQ